MTGRSPFRHRLPAVLLLIGVAASAAADGIKLPVVAGRFYPDDPGQLAALVDRLLDDAPAATVDGRLTGLIVPHAGYVFSGPVAAHAWRQLRGRPVSRVVVLAPSHFARTDRASILDSSAWRTPLGDLAIDRQAADRLLRERPDLFDSDPVHYAREHSLEAQLPFVQRAAPGARLLPVVLGSDDPALALAVGQALGATFGDDPETVLAATSDMSHYLPQPRAVAVDRETIGRIGALDTDWIAARGQERLCGAAAVTALIAAYRVLGGGPDGLRLLRYATSGDTAGPAAQVVGYSAWLAVVPDNRTDGRRIGEERMREYLSDGEKRALLRIARGAVETAVAGSEPEATGDLPPRLTEKGAAFVTLTVGGELRGCIGYTEPFLPLHECVRRVARAAALEDPRFPEVGRAELPSLEYEVSVLTPLAPVDDPRAVEVGRHGLVVRRGPRSGLLLPQVAVEQGWDRETFLAHTCRKAGLPPDCWRQPGTEILAFEAVVFGERGHER